MKSSTLMTEGRVTIPKHMRHRSFLDDAALADVALQKSGVGYAMADVHAYVAAKVRGEPVKHPIAVKRRK